MRAVGSVVVSYNNTMYTSSPTRNTEDKDRERRLTWEDTSMANIYRVGHFYGYTIIT